MAISSINIQVSTPNAFKHNDRTSKVTYTIDGSEKNEYDRSAGEAEARYMELRKEATKNYTERTGQKLQTKEEKLRWTAVVNLNAGHNLDTVKSLAQALEKKYGWQPLQIAIHRDEGHITAEGKKERNLHTHIEFFMLDKDGLYKFKKKDFRLKDMTELQTFVAEQLKMERGVSKRESGRERLEHKEYKAVKQAEQATQKQAQVKISSAHAELERSKVETAELKAAFENFRKEMIVEGGHTNEEYKELGALKQEIVSDKKISSKEAMKMLEKLKARIQEMQEPRLADKLIAASTIKTAFGQKVDTTLLKENFGNLITGLQELSNENENVLNRMMRGLNNLFRQAKHTIKKQKHTIDFLRSVVHRKDEQIKKLENELEKRITEQTDKVDFLDNITLELEKLRIKDKGANKMDKTADGGGKKQKDEDLVQRL